MRVQGTIPEEITIVSSIEQPVYRRWEGEAKVDAAVNGTREMVIPAFPVDAKNPKTLKTAIQWAENHRSWYDPELKKNVKKPDPVVQDTRKNDPMTGLQVVTLEERGNGGRAYKIRTPEKYYFDMREDVMLDTMINVGISKGGILNGKFIWGRIGSQMKLVRVGSALHSALQESIKTNNMKLLDKNTFVPGGVYEMKNGSQKCFIGWVQTARFTFTSKNKDPKGRSYDQVLSFKLKNMPKAMLWVDTWVKFGAKGFEASILDNIESPYYKSVTTTHNMIKYIGTVDLPQKIVEKTSSEERKRHQTKLGHYNYNYQPGTQTFEDSCGNVINHKTQFIMNTISDRSEMALMVPLGEKLELHSDYEEYKKIITP